MKVYEWTIQGAPPNPIEEQQLYNMKTKPKNY